MDLQTAMSYRFGPFTLYPSEGRLEREGTPIPLAPKPFDLLVFLVSNHGRLLPKDVIIEHIWPDVRVTEYNLTTTISTLRKALGEAQETYIENIPKKGYRFRAQVRQVAEGTSSSSQVPPIKPKRRTPELAALAIVAVLLLVLGFWSAQRRKTPDQKYLEEALQYERLGDDALALDALDRAITSNPKSGQAFLSIRRVSCL